ncbi:hypothetical protein IM538_04075 [Cytobacillus suaedae]|nr:hypothetical protein IM538_04075 [Cytobacillus suaedae]
MLKRVAMIAVLILVGIIFFTFYMYREQNLGDVLNIEQVERVLIVTDDKNRPNGVEIPKIDQEKKDQLIAFLNQYQVKLSMKEGWFSDYPSEQFNLYLVYKNGEPEVFTIEQEVVATTEIYEIVNAPLDYQWIQEFERKLNSE